MRHAVCNPRLSFRLTRALLFSLTIGGCFTPNGVRGAEGWQQIPADAVIVVEIDRPASILKSHYLSLLWDLVSETREFRQKLTESDSDSWRSAARFLEQSLETEWRTALSKLTSGGILVAVVPAAKESPPDVLLLVESEDRDTLTKFVTAVRAEVAKQKSKATEQQEYRGRTFYRTGDAYYSQVDQTLAASNSRRMLTEYLDRIVSEAPVEKRRIPVPARTPAETRRRSLSRVRGFVAIDWFREIREVQDALRVPAAEPAGQLLFGGYLDLLRRAHVAEFDLEIDDQGVELRGRFDAGSINRPEEWNGFFADGKTTRSLPLLRPSGTVYSASWFRDYHHMWQSRRRWLDSEAIEELEAENERQTRTGTQFGVVDLAMQLGSHYRVVAAQPVTDDDEAALERSVWPRVAAVVDLRDPPRFQERFLAPLLSMMKVIVEGLGGAVETSRIDSAELTTLTLKAPPGETFPPGFVEAITPTVAVSGDQFLAGSSREFVLDLLNELKQDWQPNLPGSLPPATTDEQFFSFTALGDFVARFQRDLERDITRQRELSPAEASREVDVLLRLLKQLGTLSGQGTLLENGFEYRITVGVPPETDE